MSKKLLIIVPVVILLSFIQSWGFSIFGIKPNLALAAVIAASFFVVDFWQALFLTGLAAFVLNFVPSLTKEILVFFLVGAGAAFVGNRLPWRYFWGNLFLVAIGTLIFYLFLAPNLAVSFVFLKELFLNLAVGALIFLIFEKLV